MSKYTIFWDKVDDLSIYEVCDWLDISITSNNKMRCPSKNHEDKKPSCSIKNNFCHCFSCGYSANPLKLIMTVKNLKKIEALQFINQYVPVLKPLNSDTSKPLYLSPWELATLGLTSDPLLEYMQPVLQQDGSKTKISFSVSKEDALNIINDKYIEHCVTEDFFLKRYLNYVSSILSEVQSGKLKNEKSPHLEPWKYDTPENLEKAQQVFDKKVEKYVIFQTGLKYSVLHQWHMEDRNSMIKLAAIKVGKQRYQELNQKIDQIVQLLEEYEEQNHNEEKEESAYGGESHAAVAR